MNTDVAGHEGKTAPQQTLVPAHVMAADHSANPNRIRRPNESVEYREARTALLTQEIELRRHIARVAAQRRDLPPGGEVPKNYEFVGAEGLVTFRRGTDWYPALTDGRPGGPDSENMSSDPPGGFTAPGDVAAEPE